MPSNQSNPSKTEKHITFIVPVYGPSGLHLGKCLYSLLENQDYPYKDVIVVFDGDDEGTQMGVALAQRDEYKDNPNIQFRVIPHSGACAARNHGLSLAKGDYVCFFDCDSRLDAGAIRTWIMAFEEHPECGFVYGGYRFPMHQGNSAVVEAKEFDPWLLTCNNYISTMNPIKRELAPKWDEGLDGLQDWDFWLTVVENGIRGHRLKDVLVVTEEPDETSISTNSHKNWKRLYNQVREKHGIPERDIAVTTMGAFFQSYRRAKFLDADYRDPQMLAIKEHSYKAVISMGYYVDSQMHPFMPFSNMADSHVKNNMKRIIHFIGTDVFQLMLRPFIEVKKFRETVPPHVDKIYANAPWLVDELAEMGIESELLYCPIESSPYQITPFPEDFTVAVYRSDSNPMHNEPFLIDVARACPDIKWKFFGGTKIEDVIGMPENIEYVGTIPEEDMPEFIASTSCILRVTVHDGFPASLAEWAMCGRPFISNVKNMPFNRYIEVYPTQSSFLQDKEETIRAIRKLQKNIGIYTDSERQKMRNYFRKLLDPKKYREKMFHLIYDKRETKTDHKGY